MRINSQKINRLSVQCLYPETLITCLMSSMRLSRNISAMK